VPCSKTYSRLLSCHEFVKVWRPVLVVLLVADNRSQTLFDQLFGNVASKHVSLQMIVSFNERTRHVRRSGRLHIPALQIRPREDE